MDFLDLTLATPQENLALDEALLLHAEAGGREVLRVWEWPAPAVVLGSAGKLAEDVDASACAADAVPILRRSSGGGTVLLGKGCLCYSLVLAFARDHALTEVRPSYAWILERIIEALGVADLEQAGISDLAIAGRKVSGNSQQRKRNHLLHHGTLLYDFDRTRVGRYLRLPARQPDYRAGRGHDEFVGNLAVPRDQIVEGLRRVWAARSARPQWSADQVRRLVEEKYACAEWVNRR
jgi:lipoate-protein ligase A